uniref:Hes family bHLH transcription factor 1 n=1 Tax=Apteryx owenii TaxID=8824 RepID=A0A8B9NVT8_APTOW
RAPGSDQKTPGDTLQKAMLLEAHSCKSSRHSKLEKADILEMTVKHLRSLQRAQMTAALSTDPTVLGKYRAGFSECMNEVTRFLSTCEGVNTEVRTRLLGHLASCMTQINAMNYPAPPPPPPLPPAAPAALKGWPAAGRTPPLGGAWPAATRPPPAPGCPSQTLVLPRPAVRARGQRTPACCRATLGWDPGFKSHGNAALV